MRNFLLYISIVAVALSLSAAPGTRSSGEEEGLAGESLHEPRMWPVDISIHLSSSFGEYRDGHLHAGIDIRSFGREGIPCRAVDNGHVSRLRASPFGYGKTVYVKLDSGETSVYAHLSEFSTVIDSVVRAAQEERGSYEIDIYPKRGALPVRRGEVVGYTGRTGTGAPHLHWELRDRDENPVNPLDLGWTIADNVPPTIRRVEWLPLSPESRVEGFCAPAVVDLRVIDGHTFAARETLVVGGRVGLAAQVNDRLDEASGRLAPYRVELEVDGAVVTSIEMRRFSYDHTLEVELAYDMTRARTKGQHFLFLFRRKGESLWHRKFVRDGVIVTDSLSAGRGEPGRVHTAVVRAFDQAGNMSTASIPFVVSRRSPEEPRGSEPAVTGGRRSAGRGELSGCYFFEGLLSIEGPVVEPAGGETPASSIAPRSEGEAASAGETVLSFSSFPKSGRTLRIKNRGRTMDLNIVPVRKNDAATHRFEEIGVGLSVGKDCLYSDNLLYVARWDDDARRVIPVGSGMRPVAPAARLGPMSAAFKKPVEIRFALSRPIEGNEAVYHFDARRSTWSMRASTARGDSVGAMVREPGIYAALADSLAPSVGAPQLRTRRSHATGIRVREVAIPIIDKGSGVDSERTTVYVDGKKQIGRWDGFSQKVFVILGGKNIIGVHDLRIVALDRVGNASELVTQLEVPPPAPKSGAQGRR